MNEHQKIILDQIKIYWELLSQPILHFSNAKISIANILFSLFGIFLTFIIARYVGRAVNHGLKNRNVESGLRDSMEKFSRYLIITLGILFSLDNLGISINSLTAIGAVLMVGIGFGLQNIAQNFISGIIILIERPIKVGDIIQVGASSGRVVDIKVRSTIIQTRDDVTIILPNSKILSEEVVSDSYSGQQIRQRIRVGVAYGSDVEKVKSLLNKAAADHPNVIADPAPRTFFVDFGESSLDFDVRFWCSDIWGIDQISSDIRTSIDRLFREEKVEIPFPQRDLHLKSGQFINKGN